MVGQAFEGNVFFLGEAVEDDFYINLADCVFGPEEIELLLKEWLKDPRPKTVNELARMYLTHLWEIQTGFLPYDRRMSYSKGAKIAIILAGQTQPQLAQVTKVSNKAFRDSDGFTGDIITVHLLSQTATLSNRETADFLANYQGEEKAGRAVKALQIIKEKDEAEVIPKILLAISNDKRFVKFQDLWLPFDLLVTNVSTKVNEVRKIIAKYKRALSTGDIVENVYTDYNKEELGNRLEFSINYFLQRDKRFVRISELATKWDLRRPSGPVLVTIDQRTLSDSKLFTTSDLDLLLFYHGFIDQCVFSFPYNREITAYHDTSEGTISGEEFVAELAKLSENREYKVKFGHPERRGDPICVSTPDEPKKIQSTVTIKQEWLADGVLKVPKRLSSYMEGTNTVHILYDQVEETLPYEENDRLIEGVGDFYSKKAIAEFDKVHLRLESIKPTRLFVYSSWRVSLDKLLQMEPQDLDWEQSSVRDCIIVVLAKFRTPAHYREIYTEIAIHKHVSWGAILGTLSRYCPSVFVHVGRGKWGLAGWTEQEGRPKPEATERGKIIEVSNEVWKAVAIIEKNDYVYRLLKKVREPLSFDEICRKLANELNLDVDALRATGFLHGNDERLRRLDNGEWALEEWFSRDDETELTKSCSERISEYSLFWLLAIIVIILLLIGTASVSIWLFVYGR